MAQNKELTFWEHLDELRGSIVRILAAVMAFAIVAFCFKEQVFNIVLAPKSAGFATYRLFESLGATVDSFKVSLINTELAQQFLIHIKISFFVGILAVSPYILYALFHFISPALYTSERRIAVKAVGSGYVMFIAGTLLAYFLIFPLTFRFLGTYQVSAEVANYISLTSYIDTLLTLCLLMGLMFELPVLCWVLARMGILSHKFLTTYRRHAVVAICIAAAVITPTADAFTLFVVAVPIYLLYELSIGIVRVTEKQKSL